MTDDGYSRCPSAVRRGRSSVIRWARRCGLPPPAPPYRLPLPPGTDAAPPHWPGHPSCSNKPSAPGCCPLLTSAISLENASMVGFPRQMAAEQSRWAT
eukprot:scaffold26830_cov122-Isochrysis_galbana.AAC.2